MGARSPPSAFASPAQRHERGARLQARAAWSADGRSASRRPVANATAPPQPPPTPGQLALLSPGFTQRGKPFPLDSLMDHCCRTCQIEFRETHCFCGECKHGADEAPICWCALSRYESCPERMDACPDVTLKTIRGQHAKTRREAWALRKPPPPPAPHGRVDITTPKV